MLTIKHVEPNGYESVVSAISTSYYPAGIQGDDSREEFIYHGCPSAPDGVGRISYGKVFVMNENGKTVSRYEFPR
jgi:hypothetical protein